MADNSVSKQIAQLAKQQKSGKKTAVSKKIDALAKKQRASAGGVNFDSALANAGGSAAKEAPKKGPVATVLDILDRPGNGVRTALNRTVGAVIDPEAAAAKVKKNTPLQNVLDVIAPTWSGVIGQSHLSTSDAIEKDTDIAGRRTERETGVKYNNTKNNADPLVKGVGGFIGDVALDPTTYIPGADIISVGGRVVKGIKGGAAAAKAVEEGATAGAKVAAVAKGAAKAATAPSKAALAKAAKKAAAKVADEEVTPVQRMLDQASDYQAPNAVKSDPVDTPVAPTPDPVAPVKPETPDTPKPQTRETWLSDAVSKLDKSVPVKGGEAYAEDIKSLARGEAGDMTPAERRLAQRALDDNFGDKAYKDYLDHFQAQHVAAAAAEKVPADAVVSAAKNVDADAISVAAKAAPEAAQEAAAVAQQAVAEVKPMPLADALTKEFVKNARKGTQIADDASMPYHVNEIDQSRLASNIGRALPAGFGSGGLSRRADAVISHLKQQFDKAEESGIPLTVAGKTPLRYDEVLQTLKNTDPVAAMLQVNKTGSHLPDSVMKAAQYVAMSDNPDRAVVQSLLKMSPKVAAAKAVIGRGTDRIEMSPADATSKMTDALMSGKAELTDMVREKSKYWAERRGNESLNIANAELKRLSDTLRVGTPGQYTEALAQTAKSIKDAATMPAAADDAAEALAKQVPPAEVSIGDNLISAAEKSASVAPKVQRPAQAIDAASMAAAPNVRNAAEEQLKELSDLPEELTPKAMGETVDFGSKATQAVLAAQGVMFGTLRKFKMDFGTGPWGQVMQGNHGAAQVYLQGVAKQINKAAKTFGRDRLATAFKALQNGTPLTDPTEAAAVESLRPLVEGLWRQDASASLVNDAFLRQGANLQELNKFIPNKAYHLPVDDLAYSAAEKGTSFVDEAAEHWRTHDISDPVDYLLTMHQALTRYTAEASVPRSFEVFAKANGLTSKVARPGFAKVTDGGGSLFAKHMDKNTFYNKEALEQLRMTEQVSKEFRGVNQVPDLVKNLDAIMNEWKMGMTSMRPGFHLRNFIGDMALTHLDGALSLRNSRDALKVLGAHKTYDGVDILKSLRQEGGALPGKGDRLLSLKVRGGKAVNLTNGDVFALAQREGLLQDFSHLEGLDTTASNTRRVLDSAKKKVGLDKVQNVAGTVATAEAHYTRMIHFIGALKQGAKKFDNADAIAEYAAKRVRKFHPDPSILSPFEQKYMRRLIPFYSWQRAMIPVIAESVLTRPGRLMVYPKASYNTAVALGVDPYSIAQPFPEDQQFPSFIANQATGPVAKIDDRYWSISPGIAQTDVLNDYVGTNPIRSIAGSLNPAIKTPIELLTGKNLQTGGNIKSPGQYLLGQVPGVNYASKAVTNAGEADAAGGDPTANSTLVANWLSGLGIQNLSKPSYAKYAAYEQAQNGGNK